MSFSKALLTLFDMEPALDHMVDVLDDLEPEKEKVLICAECNNQITSDKHRININGGHAHSFFNPQGIVFEIGCFDMAEGCRPVSLASDEFSWFPGYRWRIMCCDQCAVHLGWDFVKEGFSPFYGLILHRLRTGDD